MRNQTGLSWMGMAVGLSAAALGGLGLGAARYAGADPGSLAILGGLTLLAAVMAGRCGQSALALSRAPAGRCTRCGAARSGAGACGRCGSD